MKLRAALNALLALAAATLLWLALKQPGGPGAPMSSRYSPRSGKMRYRA